MRQGAESECLGSLVTLLTDFGLRDYYVAAVKGVLLGLAPGCVPLDISHQVDPGDVEGAAFLLAAAAPRFPSGTVHLAIVDPGVGSERRILVAERDTSSYVAPDNGLLTPLLDRARVRAVEREDLYLEGPGSTFHGRDRFAPVAAYLLRGEPAAGLGPAIQDPVRLPAQPPRRAERTLRGRILHVDRFGNLITDIPSRWFDGGTFTAELSGLQVTRWATHYQGLPAGEPAMLPGSLGTLEFSLRGESLARQSGAQRGDSVRVKLR